LGCSKIYTTVCETKNAQMWVDSKTLGQGNDTIATKLIMIKLENLN